MSNIRKVGRAGKSNFRNDLSIHKPILVIEDTKSLGLMLSQKLQEAWQCEVHIATNYLEAKECLKKHRSEYHIVVTDLNLPDAPNGEIIDLINRAKLKSIVITGTFGEDLKEQFFEKGVVDYILKNSFNSYQYVIEQVGRLYHNLSINILIVDDSVTSINLLSHVLNRQNFTIFTATNGQEALVILKKQKINLMVTDYQMPDMDGIELTIETRKLFDKSQLSILGISAQSNNDLGTQFIKNGANDFLLKPFSLEEFVWRINLNLDAIKQLHKIQKLANEDYLTQLFNRRYFYTTGEKLVTFDQDHTQNLTVAMLDIDKFKSVNDTYGHDVGDEVLIAFSALLKIHFKQQLTARLGGEEFVVLFKNLPLTQVESALNIFRNELENLKINTSVGNLTITVSIGVSSEPDENLDLMLKHADEKLYLAKEQGRNRVII